MTKLIVKEDQVTSLKTSQRTFSTGALIGAGDYHHIEQELLPSHKQRYSPSYWQRRTLAPSALLYFIGIDRKLPDITHHNLFFDEDMHQHFKAVYEHPQWPEAPLFYVCCPSKTDPSVAPRGCENLFILIPVAPGLKENASVKKYYYELIVERLHKHLGIDIRSHLLYKRYFGISDFKQEYNALKGNAYGLANTLTQTAGLKPSLKHHSIENMVYTGQLTHPGPGIPPSLISGYMAAQMLTKQIN